MAPNMNIKRKFKGRYTKDNQGYKKSNASNHTPYKEIDGGNITMDGVDIPLLAMPMDKDGNLMDMKFMKPGENYEFGGATTTFEVPVYKKGGKSKWISNKISTLVKEGKPQKQAVAIAYSMWNEKMGYGGEMEYAQNGITTGPQQSPEVLAQEEELKRLQAFAADTLNQDQPGLEGIQMNTSPFMSPEMQQNLDKALADKTFGNQPTANIPNTFPDIPADPGAISSSPSRPKLEKVQTKTMGVAGVQTDQEQLDQLKAETTAGLKAEASKLNEKDPNAGKIDQQEDFQFFNPYAGVDIPGAAYLFGQNIGKGGNKGTAIASGVKLGVGLGRNIMAGMGNQKRTQYGLNEYRENRREQMLGQPEYMAQTGGEIPDLPDPYTDKRFKGLKFTETDSIPGEVSGDWVRDNVMKVSPGEFTAPEKYQPNMGRYKPVGYFEQPVVKDSTINLRTTDKFRGNRQSLKPHIKYLEEYNPGYKVNIDYVPRQQAGGKVPEPYGKEYTGMQFKDAKAIPTGDGNLSGSWVEQNFFEVTPSGKTTPQEKYQPNMGKFKPVGYFQNPVVKDSTINLNTTDRFPGNRQSMRQYVDYLEEYNPGYKVNINYLPKKSEGGQMGDEETVPTEAMATGNYSTEDMNESPNVEVEENEYILSPDGNLTKVLGDTHENGGEKMNLEEGTRIISDHLKLGRDGAKKLGGALDTKVEAKDTYAKAMDKFYQKSGLQGIIDEEQDVMKEFKKQKEKMAEGSMKDEATFNLNMEFLSGKINDLNKAKEPLMEAARAAFDKVFEVQEDSKGAEMDQEEFQVGGQVFNSDQVIAMGKQAGLDPERALEIARAKYGGTKKKKYVGYKKGYGGKIEKMQYAGEVTGASKTDQDSTTGYTHAHLEGKKQALADGLYGGNDVNSVMETIKRNSWWYDFGGFDPTNPEDVKKFQTEFNKRAPKEAQIDVDGKFGIQTQSVLLSPKPDMKPIKQTGPSQPELLLSTGQIPARPAIANDPALGKKPAAATPGFNPAAGAGEDNRTPAGVMLMPGQEPLPPTGLIMPTKIERQYGRMDAERFTPDQQLSELNRSVLAAMRELDSLPSGQREAAIVQLQANKQQMQDEIVNKVNQQNKQIAQQEEAFNIRQGDREVDAGAIDTMSYEQRAQGAMANTISDFERFFAESASRNMANFRTIQDANLLNQMYENFDLTATGVQNTVESNFDGQAALNRYKTNQATARPQPATTKKTKAAKKGGEVKKETARVYKRKHSRVKKALNFQTKKKTRLA